MWPGVCRAGLSRLSPALTACQGAGWRVVVFSTPTGSPVPAADVVLACPLTFNSVNTFAHGHADNFAVGLLCEMVGYGVAWHTVFGGFIQLP